MFFFIDLFVDFWRIWGLIFGAKIVNLGSLGGPWHPDGPEPEKEAKKINGVNPFGRPFWHHYSMIFLSIFRYVFWMTFGTILEQFWEPKA